MAGGCVDYLRRLLGWRSSPSVPTEEGVEFTLPQNRGHFTLPQNRGHFTIPENHAEWTLPESRAEWTLPTVRGHFTLREEDT